MGASSGAMATTLIEATPFVKPCPEDEKRQIDCEKGVVVADLLNVMADLLGVSVSKLSAVNPLPDGCNVVLGAKEAVPQKVCIKGTRTMAGVPPSVLVNPKSYRSSMTKAEALAIQKDTMDFYSDALLQKQLKILQKETIQKLMGGQK